MQAMETKKWEKENKAIIESFNPARITYVELRWWGERPDLESSGLHKINLQERQWNQNFTQHSLNLKFFQPGVNNESYIQNETFESDALGLGTKHVNFKISLRWFWPVSLDKNCYKPAVLKAGWLITRIIRVLKNMDSWSLPHTKLVRILGDKTPKCVGESSTCNFDY